MRLTISTNFPDVKRALDQLHDDVARTVTARAVNRAIEQARTQMIREIKSAYVVTASYVRERLRIKRATMRGAALLIEASLDAQEKPRSANVIRFAARKTSTGVSVKIKRTGGRKSIAQAFIANKGRTVFTRIPGTQMKGRNRANKHGQRIRPVQTIDVPQMFNARRINAAVVAALEGKFPAIFERELAYALRRFQA